MKVAIAATPEGAIFPGHFAHSPVFKIYEYSNGEMRLLEVRENPLGSVPDRDYGPHHEHHHGRHGGLPKYKWLRENLLPDVEVVIAGGACQTSHMYFTSEGVKMLYVEPVELDMLIQYISENPKEFEEAIGG
ncbi:MAG: NifB/NifX family molybdenum-iron cluster-binding protein [Pyrobaculum sp.]